MPSVQEHLIEHLKKESTNGMTEISPKPTFIYRHASLWLRSATPSLKTQTFWTFVQAPPFGERVASRLHLTLLNTEHFAYACYRRLMMIQQR